jgi:hypothetical protein
VGSPLPAFSRASTAVCDPNEHGGTFVHPGADQRRRFDCRMGSASVLGSFGRPAASCLAGAVVPLSFISADISAAIYRISLRHHPAHRCRGKM